MGYLYISIASILFSSQFAFTKQYQRKAGRNLRASFLSNAIAPTAFVIITLFMQGFQLHITPFALVLSLVWAVGNCVMGYCTINAIAGSLSNYSIFMMAGGMILPCFYGAIWNGDTFGVFKVIGILLILAAVIAKVDFKEKTNAKTYIYLMALFMLNGLMSILSSMYAGDVFPYAKPSAEQFSLLRSLTTMAVGWVAFITCMFYTHNKEKKQLGDAYDPAAVKSKMLSYVKASPWSIAGGLINSIGNMLLLYALETLQPSLQYPIITGGSILLSALIGLIFFKEKPDKRTWASVALVIIGTIVIIL